MASPLEGLIAKELYKGFKGKTLKGSIRYETLIPGSEDSYGDPLTTVNYKRLEGFISMYTDFYRARNNIPDTDYKVNIFARSIKDFTPKKGMEVLLGGKWNEIVSVSVDPATALWVCRAHEIDPPVDVS